ncbi:Glutamate receptor, partial [Theobroma cacao]
FNYEQTYDAVVGDTTIVANRSQYVDFTLPYTESGVSMIVPIRDNRRKNAWVFLKPLTWDLWVASACFFFFIGFVVWVLEHRINEDFMGPPSYQAGTSFWFSFSTVVFAHRERVVSNLARFVVIIWCFVVLILTQSYTASLTSLLTVQQLQPTVTDIQELLKKGEKVGFKKGSFVEGILKGLTFPESQLIEYETLEELHDLFTKGSANGGISATLDEIPYMKLLFAKYCNQYTAVEPKFRTDGFGFVFPRGSPLVADVSRAILNVTQGEKMNQIEQAWFKKESSCFDTNTLVSHNSLGVESFWGLFLIAGVTSISALIIFAAMFFIGVAGDSPNTNCPQSPSSYSNQTELGFVFLADQGRATENGDLTPSAATSPEIFPSSGRHSIELTNTKATAVTSPLLHFFCLVIISCRILLMHVVAAPNSSSIPVNVGVVLDLDSKFGKIGLSCINMALSDFYATHASYRTRLVLNPRDSKDVVGAAAAGTCFLFHLSPQLLSF